MSNEVKRYDISGFGGGMVESQEGAWYHMDDYAALEAEFKELAERYAKLQTGEDGLVSRVVAERDAALAELAAIRAAGGEQVEVVAIVDESDDGKFAEVVDVPGVGCTVKMGDKLMTIAQHQRIVAAMAAELETQKLGVKVYAQDAAYAERQNARLRAELEAARKQEPVQVVAVAVMRDDGDGGLVPDWLLEGGTAEMVEGMVLIAADDAAITGEDGHGEVFKLPPLAGQVSVPDGWRIERSGDRIIVQQLPSGAGYAAAREGESGIAESVLYLLADTLLATPSMEVKHET